MPVAAPDILRQDVEVFAPCALGAILNAAHHSRICAPRSWRAPPTISWRSIATALALHAAGVLYAPDYVINAGGIINVFHEYYGVATRSRCSAAIAAIPARLTDIFERSRRENRPTNAVADELARARIAGGARRASSPRLTATSNRAAAVQ